jgi:pimeloyl-ACP methyl ester carboxylesterase
MPSFGDLTYEITGRGEPVVLLNGVMMTMQSWVFQRRALEPHFRCILHDFRGQLLSPGRVSSMSEHVADLVALLDHLQIDIAHLVGTSYGGEVGMMFAAAHPERVRSLTAIACVSHIDAPLRDAVTLWRDVALAAPETLYEITAPHNFSPGFLETMIGVGKARLASYPPGFFRGFAELCDAFLRLEIDPTEVRCPTLVICGEDDALKPVHYSRTIAAQIANARLEIVPGPHAVVIESPERVNELLLEWLE